MHSKTMAFLTISRVYPTIYRSHFLSRIVRAAVQSTLNLNELFESPIIQSISLTMKRAAAWNFKRKAAAKWKTVEPNRRNKNIIDISRNGKTNARRVQRPVRSASDLSKFSVHLIVTLERFTTTASSAPFLSNP